MGVAMNLPDGFSNWNRAMKGAYLKGCAAAEKGLPETACPYVDKRKDCGRLTWSRAFMAAWHDGWNEWRRQNPAAAYYHDRANGSHAAKAP